MILFSNLKPYGIPPNKFPSVCFLYKLLIYATSKRYKAPVCLNPQPCMSCQADITHWEGVYVCLLFPAVWGPSEWYQIDDYFTLSRHPYDVSSHSQSCPLVVAMETAETESKLFMQSLKERTSQLGSVIKQQREKEHGKKTGRPLNYCLYVHLTGPSWNAIKFSFSCAPPVLGEFHGY